MEIRKKTNISWQSISTLLVLYCAIASTFPPLKTLSFYNLTWLAAMVMWTFGVIVTRPNFFINMPIQRAISVFFAIYTFVIAYLFGNPTIGNRFLELAQIPFFYWVYQYNIKYGYGKSNFTIIKWTIPLLVVTCIKTGMGLLESPYLARSIKSGGEDTRFLWEQGIGGYELIYFITILSVIILYIIINMFRHNTVLFNLALLSGLFLLIGVIILSNYFTALLMIIMSMLFMWLLHKRGVVSKVGMMITLVVGALFSEEIVSIGIDIVMAILIPGRTLDRLMTIQSDILTGQAGVGEISDRWNTIQSSLEGFYENPILGLVSTDMSFDGEHLTGFGQHSQFVDTFALYGIFGILQVYFILQPFVARFNEKLLLKNFSIIMMIVTIMLFTFNNVTPSTGLAIFLFYPVAYDWMKEKMT